MSEGKEPPRVFYRIRGWSEEFENNQSRVLKYLQWVVVHNVLGTDAYAELLDHPNGAAHFGVWTSCLMLAASCNPRGTLLKEGGVPHQQTSIARVCRIPAALCYEALERLVKIGWLEELPVTEHVPLGVEHKRARFQQTTATAQQTAVTSRARVEGNGMEYKTPLPPSAEGGGRHKLSREEQRRAAFARKQEIQEQADALNAKLGHRIS
jgi:hypothetical protein